MLPGWGCGHSCEQAGSLATPKRGKGHMADDQGPALCQLHIEKENRENIKQR